MYRKYIIFTSTVISLFYSFYSIYIVMSETFLGYVLLLDFKELFNFFL